MLYGLVGGSRLAHRADGGVGAAPGRNPRLMPYGSNNGTPQVLNRSQRINRTDACGEGFSEPRRVLVGTFPIVKELADCKCRTRVELSFYNAPLFFPGHQAGSEPELGAAFEFICQQAGSIP
jgi:hypothetical protein